MERKNILVICTGNSCRSQMAEGYLRYFAGDRAEVYSAGIDPHGVDPRAIAIMREDGIDISDHTSNHVDEYMHMIVDFVITVCDNAKESCPYFPAFIKTFHCDFSDPSKSNGTEEEVIHQFRKVRESIKEYCREFVINNLNAEEN